MNRRRLVTLCFAAFVFYAPPSFASDALWPRALPVGRWEHADSALELSIERGSALVFRAGQSETRGEFYSYQQVRGEYWGCFSLTARSEATAPEKPGGGAPTAEKPAAAGANAPPGGTARAPDPANQATKPANEKAAESAAPVAATGGTNSADNTSETRAQEGGPNKSSAPANFNNRPGRNAPAAPPPGPPDLSWITPQACVILAFEGADSLTLYAFPDGERPGPILRFARPGARRVEPAQGP